jgi:DNA-binding response OmpR family regulator
MSMRIIVVEDEAIIALCIGMTLQEAGHEVLGPVASFDSCLKLVEQEVPELALIDINLEKGGSGIDVARVLLDRWRVMSIFVSSQHRQARDNMEAAIGCLDKPFATRSLVETIEVAKDLKQGVIPLTLPEGLDLFVGGRTGDMH